MRIFSTLILAGFLGASINLRAEGGGGHEVGGHKSLSGANLHLYPAPQTDKIKSAKPEAVKLEAPAALAKVTGGTTSLKWTAAKGADTYHLQVAKDPNFKWLIVNENWVRGNSYELKNLEAGKQYFWRVAGLNPKNDAEYLKGPYSASSFESR